MGYSKESKNAYLVLNIRTGAILTRTDCLFDESLPECTLDDVGVELDDDNYDDNDYPTDNDVDENEDNDIVSSDTDDKSVDVTDSIDKNDQEYDMAVINNVCEECEPEEIIFVPYVDVNNHISIGLERWTREVCCIVHEAIALPPDPKNMEEALSSPMREQWLDAIEKELKNFDDRGTFEPAPQTGRAMKTKMIFKYHYNNDMSIKVKARLVACGYSQIYGLDYRETYAPTTSIVVVFILFHIAAMFDMHVGVFDVSAAFLEGKNDFEQYAVLPKELSPGGKIALRVKVVGNFYGEKQGPKIWNDQLDSILVNMGFIRCPVMPCLYYKYDGDDIIFIAIHVDDGLVVTNNTSSLDKFMKLFLTYVRKAEMLKEFCKYIGIDCVFIPKLHHVVLDQTINIENYFHDFNKRVDTPMMSTTNLRTAKPNTNNESLLPITGRLRYLADRTRPDILVATGEISTGGAKDPSDEHLKTALRTMDYLTTTSDLGLTLGGEGDFVIFAYVDASYITDGNAKSRLGGCVFLGYDCGAVMCFSRNDTIKSTISHSSTESEIRAIDVLLRELIHIIEICLFLSINLIKP